MLAASVLWLSLAHAPQEDRPPPKRPAERFTLQVQADPAAVQLSTEPLEELVNEVTSELKKRKHWVLVTERSDRAELVVHVRSHRVREEHVNELTTRVRYRAVSDDGTIPVDYVDTNYLSQRHYVRVELEGLGYIRTLVGYDGRRKGASLNRAAENLAEEVEGFLKEYYWDLVERRRRHAAVGTGLPREVLAAASRPKPPAATIIVDPKLTRYRNAVRDYQSGDFLRAAGEVWSLEVEQLYEMGTLFLGEERTDDELAAAALLHTECVVTLPRQQVDRLELARRNAQHLALAQRYAQAIADPERRHAFQRRWYLAVAFYYHETLQSTGVSAVLGSGLRMFPGDRELLYALGAFHETWGTLQREEASLHDAERIYRALLADGASWPDLPVRLAHVLIGLGRLDEAEALLDDASPEELPGWVLKGQLALGKGRYSEARQAFEQALALDPSCQTCAVSAAVAYERSGLRDRGRELVSRWLTGSSEGRDAWWRFLLGRSYEHEALLDSLRRELDE